MADQKNILVFSAHAADFVWRARGAIALYASQGHLWQYYTDLSKRRGRQAVRNGGPKDIKYAEALPARVPSGDSGIVMSELS